MAGFADSTPNSDIHPPHSKSESEFFGFDSKSGSVSANTKQTNNGGGGTNNGTPWVPNIAEDITLRQEDVTWELFQQCSGMQRKEIVTLVQAMRDYNLNGESKTDLYMMTFGNRYVRAN